MAFAFITEFPIQGDDRTTTNYDAVNDRLTTEGSTRRPHPALRRIRRRRRRLPHVVNIWDTEAQGQAYLEDKVMNAVREVMGDDTGAPPSRQGSYDLHHLAKP